MINTIENDWESQQENQLLLSTNSPQLIKKYEMFQRKISKQPILESSTNDFIKMMDVENFPHDFRVQLEKKLIFPSELATCPRTLNQYLKNRIIDTANDDDRGCLCCYSFVDIEPSSNGDTCNNEDNQESDCVHNHKQAEQNLKSKIQLERSLNDAFSVYKDMYYGSTGYSTVRVNKWRDNTCFELVLLFKKITDSQPSPINNGHHQSNEDSVFEGEVEADDSFSLTWDTIHHVFVDRLTEDNCEGKMPNGETDSLRYRISSTLILQGNNKSNNGQAAKKQHQHVEYKLNKKTIHTSRPSIHHITDHIVNIGKLIEDIEGKLRGSAMEIYLTGVKSSVLSLHKPQGVGEFSKQENIRTALIKQLFSTMNEASQKICKSQLHEQPHEKQSDEKKEQN